MRSEQTKACILQVAEPMFADHGLRGVSMRQIAAAAEVDLSLVLYHFGSKDRLYAAVVERLLSGFNRHRESRLDALLARVPDPSVVELFDVIISAWLDLHFWQSRRHARLLLRGVADQDRTLGSGTGASDALILRFIGEVHRVAAPCPEEQVHWKYHAITGALIFFLSAPERIARLSGGRCTIESYAEVRLVLLGMVRDLFPETDGRPVDLSSPAVSGDRASGP